MEITRARGREREKEISPFYSSYSPFLVWSPVPFHGSLELLFGPSIFLSGSLASIFGGQGW